MTSRIGKYELLRRLGQGAMGEVFLARDPVIGREVAIKTIAAGHADGEEARERFLREARAAGALNHPNLVTVHEFGEDQGTLFLVMEYVPGEDLHGLIALRALRPREVLEVLAQVCDGLDYAHGHGVLHRDIKPSNIRVARPGGRLQAKVMDFGIARVAGSDFTGTGTLLGTFGYMAPEYIQSGHPEPRSDLFAVGVILHEALSGERPFKGDTTATVLYRIVHDAPPPLDDAALEGVSPALRAVLERALAKDPERRFARAADLAAALRAAQDPAWRGLPGRGPVPAGAPTVRTVPPRRRTGWWLAGGLLLLAGAGGAAFVLRPVPKPVADPPRPEPPPRREEAPPPVEPPPPRREDPPPRQDPPPPRKEAAPAPVDPPRPAREEPRPEPPPPRPEEPRPAAPEGAPGPLDAAALKLDRDPRGALAILDPILAQDRGNPRAWALKLAAHYEADDLEGFRAAARSVRDLGIPRWALMRVPRFRLAMEREARNPKLPPGFREELGEAGPDRPRPPLRRPRF